MSGKEEGQEQTTEGAAEEPKVDEAAASSALEGEVEGDILEPGENDVIAGRGAAVNLNKGNQKFRALCFKRKAEFDAGSHAAKRRIATEIVNQTFAAKGRFLKRKVEKGAWHELNTEKAILKACQVMRDYQRPDRLLLRGQAGSGRRRQRTTESTPMELAPVIPAVPLPPIVENPFGVNDNDVLSGRGAFINGHIGNARFRELCSKRKPQFDAGTYTEKRALATEVVNIVRSLTPPGRFLKRIKEGSEPEFASPMPEWEELSDDRAVHKACQVMRDIARPDRQGDRKRKQKDESIKINAEDEAKETEVAEEETSAAEAAAALVSRAKDSITMLADTTAEASAVQEAMAATEEALNKALDSVPKEKLTTDDVMEV